MSEVTSRPSVPRGRGSARGGRGGYSSRGSRGGNRQTNGAKVDVPKPPTYEDEGEIGLLKKQYSSKLSTIQEMFPDWTSEDIVFALQETNGDLEGTIERISEGNISQWGEVKKKTKDRGRSNAKDAAGSNDATTQTSRGGRGRGISDGQRGGRGRATDRGRAGRGSRGTAGVNGSRGLKVEKDLLEPAGDAAMVDSTSSWETPAVPGDSTADGWDQANHGGNTSPDASWEMVTPSEAAPPSVAEAQRPSLRPDGSRSWASMLKPTTKPAPKPTPKSAKPEPSKSAATTISSQEQPVQPAPSEEQDSAIGQGLPAPSIEELPPGENDAPDSPGLPMASPAVNIPPSKDELTKTNLEQVLDTSAPPVTATAASTVATTIDPRSVTPNAGPLHISGQQHPTMRPGLGGFATSAFKATAASARNPSFQRRVMEQQEAVVMPGNHAVDRAAVQFGSMGLNGTSDDLDVDDEREEAETRAQPPQQSPVAPRASLPPAPQHPIADTLPIPRQAPGLPPVAPQAILQQSMQPSGSDQALPHQAQSTYPYNQFNNRYGPSSTQQETTQPASKPYEPFGQQIQQPSTQQPQYDGYPAHSQAPSQHHVAQQAHTGSFSSPGNDYSSYYTSDNQRNAYQNYYGAYGQPSQSQQDAGSSQQRTGSAFGSTGAEQPSQYATSQAQQVPPARYGAAVEAQNSGHSTPNIASGQQGQTQSQAQQSHQMGQQQGHGQAAGQQGAYPYGHPYYNNSPYYANYMNQYGYGGNQGGYGTGPYAGAGAGGKYGQPHQAYGMSPQSAFDHQSASPATAGGYGQQPQSLPGRDASTVGSYGRAGSAQPTESQQQQTGSAGAFGGMPDVFSRNQSAYSAQHALQQGGQQGGNDEASRGYGDVSKVPGGPSPAPGQAGGRPGSAANNMQGQTGQSTSQAQGQGAYGAYPQMQGQQHSQYGTVVGGASGHHQTGAQSHQGSGYGAGYGSGFGGNYYGNNSRGGWGGNYGH